MLVTLLTSSIFISFYITYTRLIRDLFHHPFRQPSLGWILKPLNFESLGGTDIEADTSLAGYHKISVIRTPRGRWFHVTNNPLIKSYKNIYYGTCPLFTPQTI